MPSSAWAYSSWAQQVFPARTETEMWQLETLTLLKTSTRGCVRVTRSAAAAGGSSAVTGKCWCCSGASGALPGLAGSGRSHSPLGLPCTGRRQTLEPAVPGLKEKDMNCNFNILITLAFLSFLKPHPHIPSENTFPVQVNTAEYKLNLPSCSYRGVLTWSLHIELTLPRLLLPMATGGPIGGSEPAAPEPPAMETVMLMLLYTPCWPKFCELVWPVWLYKLPKGKTNTSDVA